VFIREEILKERLREDRHTFVLKLHDYAGVIHLHSDYSHDGRTSILEIVEAARANGIDFVMLTDHDWLQAKHDGYERSYDGVHLIIGIEVTPRYNHYLAFGIDEPLITCDLAWVFPHEDEIDISPQFYIDWVRSKGGIGFIAHPDHEGAPRFHVKQFSWNDWTVSGYTGIGIWDFMTDWQSRLKGYPSALLGYYFTAYRLRGPKKETLKRWDELNRTRKSVGIGELDNHSTVKKLLGIQFHIFPFREAFRFIRTHILTEAEFLKEDELDRAIILSALRRGRAYVALEYFARAKGFSFVIMDESEVATMGDEFLLDDLAIVQIELPVKGKIRLIKDGELFRETVGRELTCGIDELGIYRVEVYLWKAFKYRPWIFSNPIYVK
jgi:GNAT superfamily N-acetyltransferase